MAVWSSPKTDWAPSDAPSTTDFNRIEGNAIVLRNTREISVSMETDPLSHPRDLYRTSIRVPDGQTLKLRRFGCHFTNNGSGNATIPHVSISGGSVYDPGSAITETTPDFDLYVNNSGSDQLKTLLVTTQGGDLDTWSFGSGFYLSLELVDNA